MKHYLVIAILLFASCSTIPKSVIQNIDCNTGKGDLCEIKFTDSTFCFQSRYKIDETINRLPPEQMCQKLLR